MAKLVASNDFLTLGERIIRVSKRVSAVIFGRTTAQRFFRYYLLIVILGAVLLYLPPSLVTGRREYGDGLTHTQWDFFDALFTSSSAFSDTGLSVSSTKDTFTFFGQFVIMLLIQVGGFGFMTIKLLIWRIFLSKRTTLSERIMLQAERGASKLGTSSQMILVSSVLVLAVEIVCALGMMVYFYFYPAYEQIPDPNPIYAGSCVVPQALDTPSEAATCTQLSVDSATYVPAYHNWSNAAWWGFFHSISAINNAGFDIMGNNSLAPYRNDGGIGLQVIALFELTIGGLGFPLLFDVLMWFKTRATGERFKFSLFTKVSASTHIVLILLGLGLNYGTEVAALNLSGSTRSYYLLGYDNATGAFGADPEANRWWAVAFSSIGSRSAGFSTLDLHILSTSTKSVQGVLMFLGTAPSSTGGGIRTTTIAIIVVAIVQRMMGRERITMFKKTIPRETVRNSFSVFIVAAMLVGACVFVVQASPLRDTTTVSLGIADSFFEVASAFGTVGYSAGLTPHLAWWSLLFVSLLMFVGQLGVSSTVLSWARKESRKNTYAYPTEQLVIG